VCHPPRSGGPFDSNRAEEAYAFLLSWPQRRPCCPPGIARTRSAMACTLGQSATLECPDRLVGGRVAARPRESAGSRPGTTFDAVVPRGDRAGFEPTAPHRLGRTMSSHHGLLSSRRGASIDLRVPSSWTSELAGATEVIDDRRSVSLRPSAVSANAAAPSAPSPRDFCSASRCGEAMTARV
jgi:hypothetical protein